ncbi:MAG TPA: HAD hydrolase-like protein [Blastocatellia bacterium]|nr:HAD hydrolase-like protein [Blastocatellia bacterium]
MRNRAVLFDLDGTLIDTTGLILGCFDHAWKAVRGRTHARESLIGTFGIPLREAMTTLLVTEGPSGLPDPDNEVHSSIIERLLVEYRAFNLANHDLMALPFAGVCETLETLRSRGYIVGVVTSKSRELATRGLTLCGLDQLVDASVFLEDTDRHKPSPDPLEKCLHLLALEPESAAYVGDSRFDIMAGKAASVCTVGALWGPSSREELERETPDYLVERIEGLLDIFD